MKRLRSVDEPLRHPAPDVKRPLSGSEIAEAHSPQRPQLPPRGRRVAASVGSDPEPSVMVRNEQSKPRRSVLGGLLDVVP